jgi:hypothetical protein
MKLEGFGEIFVEVKKIFTTGTITYKAPKVEEKSQKLPLKKFLSRI